MIHAAIALAADAVSMLLLLLFTDLGIYAVVISMIVYAVVMCLLNNHSIRRYLGYRNPWRKAYLTPLLASIPMAAAAGGVYYGLYMVLHRNFISLAAALFIAVIIYFVFYLLISRPTEEELRLIPGGGLLVRFARRLRR